MPTAALRLVYHFDDGETSDLALGTIDSAGVLAVSKVAEGAEERVATLVEELNASPQVFVRSGSRTPGAARGTLKKTAVLRGMPGFIDALVETARRFYGVELRFDPVGLAGGIPAAPALPADAGGGASPYDPDPAPPEPGVDDS
jgi:hypothetical protein